MTADELELMKSKQLDAINKKRLAKQLDSKASFSVINTGDGNIKCEYNGSIGDIMANLFIGLKQMEECCNPGQKEKLRQKLLMMALAMAEEE
jgi:hypothetical protein